MAEKLIVLSTNSERELRDMLARERSRTVNARTPNVPVPSIQAPEVYIGLSEYDIPALTLGADIGTGTGSEADDTPGHGAVCNLYRLLGDDLDAMTIESMGIAKHVFNLSTTAIARGTWFLAIRDKPGSWLALPFNGGGSGGGGGGRGLHFTLPSALTNAQQTKALCTVTRYWGGASPGSSVTIYNPESGGGAPYMFAAATGAKGLAVYDDVLDRWWIAFVEGRTDLSVGPFYKYVCVSGTLTQYASVGFECVAGLVQGDVAPYV